MVEVVDLILVAEEVVVEQRSPLEVEVVAVEHPFQEAEVVVEELLIPLVEAVEEEVVQDSSIVVVAVEVLFLQVYPSIFV